MRPSLIIAAVLPASCIAIPLSQVEDSTTKFSLSNVDVTPAQPEPLNTSFATIRPRDARSNPPCPPGQTFDRSICFTSDIVSRFCNGPPGQAGERREIYCFSDEVCVQRRLSDGRTFAECHPIATLIRWKSDPNGNKEGCTSISEKKGRFHNVGTIVYDINKHPIQVGKITYLREPGNIDKGIRGSTSFFDSDVWNFANNQFMRGKYELLIY
ncbi:secreted in xylem 6 [Colletotrichum truncatum]|uniref:Secreted in xylem 6 n=1 Tax=Colletotrichum truncatum TaxID=5467 RepID=A0ACC3YTZ1_COLTU|nr:secreted in xylem 6 [Colletotrichum truncatum]KAF6781229.1 secreted in xylem 6 [Colletotrichum truncatum]